MWNPTGPLEVSDEAKRTLQAWVNAPTAPQRVVMRARIVLLATEGMATAHIAREVDTSRPTVLLWRNRFADGGVAALVEDAPGRGRPVSISPKKVRRIVKATTQTRPRGATHWSTRTMAQAQGVSAATVQRIWDAHGLRYGLPADVDWAVANGHVAVANVSRAVIPALRGRYANLAVVEIRQQ